MDWQTIQAFIVFSVFVLGLIKLKQHADRVMIEDEDEDDDED